MIKITIFTFVLALIVSTSLVKNSTKELDDKIYSTKENMLFLKDRFKDAKLEYNYLSSSEKLLEHQKMYFENSLNTKSLKKFNTLEIKDNDLIINELKVYGKTNEQ